MKDYIGQELNLSDFFILASNVTIIGVIIKKSEQKNLIHCYCCERNGFGAIDIYRSSFHPDYVIAIDISSELPQNILDAVKNLKKCI